MLSTKNLKQHQLLTTDDIKYLYNSLRKASITWEGRKEVLRRSRQKVFVRRAKNGNAVYKYQWQCAICFAWKLNESELEVDHIKEIGGITEFNGDWNEVIGKMFPRPVEDHLQVLCIPCHKKKTKQFMSAIHKFQRKVKV